MNKSARFPALLLAATSPSALASAPAHAQSSQQDEQYPEDEEEDIVVTGARERGAVVGDVKPEQQLQAADIRALGVSSISDLLTELGPQLQSASGKPPVTLLEGHRISSFREIASLPAEAIARVDILPEEVGLRYGYGADQKVMNIVLRQRFRAFTGELTGRLPTEGDGATGEVELGHLSIRRGQRVNINAEYSRKGAILESDRGIDGTDSMARTLSPAREELTVDASYHRPIGERTQATLSGEIGTSRSESNVGLALPALTIPGGTPYAGGAADRLFYPTAPGLGALERSSSTQNGQVGLTLNAMRSVGQWTLTGSYARQETRGITARPYDLAAYANLLRTGSAAIDPSVDVPASFLIDRPADETQSRSDTANLDFVYNRPLLKLPAGDVSATLKLGGSMMRLESSLNRNLTITGRSIARDTGSGSLSLDFPFSRQADKLGRISANANVGVDHYSDAGTLRTFGFGLNWTPRRGINLSASYRNEENAPTAAQLGDPQAVTQFVPVFDYVRGESVLVTTITGGNSALGDARDESYRLGLVLNLLSDPDVRLTVDYSHRETSGGIMGFPGITAETASAFPGRFLRDPADPSDPLNPRVGRLVQVDLRPINITAQKRDSLRWGINFSKRLRTPQSQINAMREAFQRRFPNGVPPGGPGAPAGQGAPGGEAAAGQAPGAGAPSGANRQAGGPGRGFGGFGGGGGRINFAIYHEWAFANTTQLAPTLPALDLLDGDTLGGGAGPSRHQIELQAGLSQSGYGLRLTGKWASATRINGVVGEPTSQLRFGDLATLNLRLFANLTQMPKLVQGAPLLRGVRVQIGIDNLFNTRQRVTDGTGAVPFAFRPGFVDPIGRSVRVSVRKLFF
ncbi:MAG: TonB-dependent receptor [Sphingomonadales bacterium]|nr:TonB-dependent receptor [Sphingomonadales bacterium]